jgi:hypothetical protein
MLGRIGGLKSASRGIEARRAQTAKARATLYANYIAKARAMRTPDDELEAQARRLHAIDLAGYRLKAYEARRRRAAK